jgi:hypothetical protein
LSKFPSKRKFPSKWKDWLEQLQQNIDREEQEKQEFFAAKSDILDHSPSTRTANNSKIIADLTFWIRYSS